MADFDPTEPPLAPLGEFCDWWMGSPMHQATMSDVYFSILDVVTMCPVGAWEPGSGTSAREALDAWYETSVACAEADLAERPEVPRGADERSQRIALILGRQWQRWRAEHQRTLDLLAESYEAGLVSVGDGDSDWVDRSRSRVTKWSDGLGFLRHEQLWLLDDPLYQASRELIPPYWG